MKQARSVRAALFLSLFLILLGRALWVTPAAAQTTQPALAALVANHAMHLRATDVPVGNQTTARYRWDFGETASKYNAPQGYSAAHFYASAGTFTATLTVTEDSGQVTSRAWTVSVTPDKRPVKNFSNESQLRSIAGPGHVIAQATSDLTVSATINCGPDTLVDLGKHRLSTNTARMSVLAGSGMVIRNGSFHDSTGETQLARLKSDSVLMNVSISKAAHIANLEWAPTRVLIQDVSTTSVSSLKHGGIFTMGNDIALLGVVCPNASGEQTVRNGGANCLSVAYCDLGNIDADGSGADIAKQSLAEHKGDYATVYKNILRGGRYENGPLGGKDGLTKPDHLTSRMRYVQFIENDCRFTATDGRCQITYGSEKLLIAGNLFSTPSGADVWLSGTSASQGYPEYNSTVKDVWIRRDNRRVDGQRLKVYIGPGCANIHNETS